MRWVLLQLEKPGHRGATGAGFHHGGVLPSLQSPAPDHPSLPPLTLPAPSEFLRSPPSLGRASPPSSHPSASSVDGSCAGWYCRELLKGPADGPRGSLSSQWPMLGDPPPSGCTLPCPAGPGPLRWKMLPPCALRAPALLNLSSASFRTQARVLGNGGMLDTGVDLFPPPLTCVPCPQTTLVHPVPDVKRF